MFTKILRFPTIKERTGLSGSLIYQKKKKNEFPSPISLGDRAVGWIESEIEDWILNRIKESRTAEGIQNDHY